ncbi:MAG: hypothetical protein OXF46_09005, partial [Rhodobacteraceae bacterium]|nr:hypothetical protein [Paracoccaceae bacterium]
TGRYLTMTIGKNLIWQRLLEMVDYVAIRDSHPIYQVKKGNMYFLPLSLERAYFTLVCREQGTYPELLESWIAE